MKHTLTDSLSLHLTGALHSQATVLRSVLWPSLLHGVIVSSLRLGSRLTKARQIRRVGHRLPVAVDWTGEKSDATVNFRRRYSLVPASNERCPHSLSRSLRRSDRDSVACRRRRMRCRCSSRRRTWTDNWNSGRYTLWAQKNTQNIENQSSDHDYLCLKMFLLQEKCR